MISNKRGQFFLLAAVIISAIVISFGMVNNSINVNKQPENLYDFSYEVKRETGEVMNYEVYNNIEGEGTLEDFVSLLAKEVIDKDPEVNFMFIYGDKKRLVIDNYLSESVRTNGDDVGGGGAQGITNVIDLNGFKIYVDERREPTEESDSRYVYDDLPEDVEDIEIEISNQRIKFPVSDHRQVILLIQKEVDDESFVSVE